MKVLKTALAVLALSASISALASPDDIPEYYVVVESSDSVRLLGEVGSLDTTLAKNDSLIISGRFVVDQHGELSKTISAFISHSTCGANGGTLVWYTDPEDPKKQPWTMSGPMFYDHVGAALCRGYDAVVQRAKKATISNKTTEI